MLQRLRSRVAPGRRAGCARGRRSPSAGRRASRAPRSTRLAEQRRELGRHARRVLDQVGSRGDVVGVSETASSMPWRSMIVPRARRDRAASRVCWVAAALLERRRRGRRRATWRAAPATPRSEQEEPKSRPMRRSISPHDLPLRRRSWRRSRLAGGVLAGGAVVCWGRGRGASARDLAGWSPVPLAVVDGRSTGASGSLTPGACLLRRGHRTGWHSSRRRADGRAGSGPRRPAASTRPSRRGRPGCGRRRRGGRRTPAGGVLALERGDSLDAWPMPAFSFSIETCIATIPMSRNAISADPHPPADQAVDDPVVGQRKREAPGTHADARGGCRDRGQHGRRAAAGSRRGGAADRAGHAARGPAGRRSVLARTARGCAAAAAARSGGRGHAVTSSLRAARSRADFARGLSATSPGVGTTARREQQFGLGLAPAGADREVGRADAARARGRRGSA